MGETIRIADAVYLHAIPTDKFKSAFLSMHFVAPLATDTAAAYALVPRVLRRGCERYPELSKITEQLQYLYNATIGGRTVKRGESQLIGPTVWMLGNAVVPTGTDILGGVTDLLREIWFCPLTEDGAFRPSYIESEKQTQIDAIRAKINNKGAYAVKRCYEEMCRGERYGLSPSGTEEGVASLTPSQLYAAYTDMLRTLPCEIHYVGGGDIERIADTFRRAFADVPRDKIVRAETEVVLRAKSVRRVTEEQATKQAKLALGFRMGGCESDGMHAAFLLLNEVYGGSPTSKLFMNVREKRSLCYSVSSAIEHAKGTMLVTCGISNEKKEDAEAEILAQLDDIRNGKITDAEWIAAKKSLRGALTQIEDEPDSMAMWSLYRSLAGRAVTPEETISEIESLTREDIADTARRMTLDTVYFMQADGSMEEEDDDDA